MLEEEVTFCHCSKNTLLIHKAQSEMSWLPFFNLKYTSLGTLLPHNLPQWWDLESLYYGYESIYFFLFIVTYYHICDYAKRSWSKEAQRSNTCSEMSHTKMKPLDQFLIPDPHIYYNHPEMVIGIYRTALAQVGTKAVIMLFL